MIIKKPFMLPFLWTKSFMVEWVLLFFLTKVNNISQRNYESAKLFRIHSFSSTKPFIKVPFLSLKTVVIPFLATKPFITLPFSLPNVPLRYLSCHHVYHQNHYINQTFHAILSATKPLMIIFWLFHLYLYINLSYHFHQRTLSKY